MRAFGYHRPASLEAALASLGPDDAVLAGGTDLLPLWKIGAAAPGRVVDIARLPLDQVRPAADGGLVLGALARMVDVAGDVRVRQGWPALAQALEASASPQVRNLATLGGNLMQRTRCPYFRSPDLPCNKRQPGSGCAAREGETRGAALFGASPACVAVQASDLAVALVAFEARVRLIGPAGERVLPVAEFLRAPGDQPERDTELAARELILAVELPPAPGPSAYLKVRDRAAFEFAVVSAAVALEFEAGVVRQVRIAAGGVATRPWRLIACEAALAGRPLEPASVRAAAEHAAQGAQPLAHNGFKLPLLARTVERAILLAGGLA